MERDQNPQMGQGPVNTHHQDANIEPSDTTANHTRTVADLSEAIRSSLRSYKSLAGTAGNVTELFIGKLLTELPDEFTPEVFSKTVGDLYRDNSVIDSLHPTLTTLATQIKPVKEILQELEPLGAMAELILARRGLSTATLQTLIDQNESMAAPIRHIVRASLNIELPFLINAVSPSPEWRSAVGSVDSIVNGPLPGNQTQTSQLLNTDAEFASYFATVQELSSKVFAIAKKHGLEVEEGSLNQAPIFGFGQIEANGSVVLVFDSNGIVFHTPFGEIKAASCFSLISGYPNSLVDEITAELGLTQVRVSSSSLGLLFGSSAALAVTRGPNGEGLPSTVKRLEDYEVRDPAELSDIWDRVKPANRKGEGEEHLAPPDEIASYDTIRLEELKRQTLTGTIRDRRDAIYTLGTLGKEHIPHLIDLLRDPSDEIGKSAFYSLEKFGKRVNRYGDQVAEALVTLVNNNKCGLDTTSYLLIGYIRKLGPVSPTSVVPALLKSAASHSDCQWEMDALGMYGKDAVSAIPLLEAKATTGGHKEKIYANQSLTAIRKAIAAG